MRNQKAPILTLQPHQVRKPLPRELPLHEKLQLRRLQHQVSLNSVLLRHAQLRELPANRRQGGEKLLSRKHPKRRKKVTSLTLATQIAMIHRRRRRLQRDATSDEIAANLHSCMIPDKAILVIRRMFFSLRTIAMRLARPTQHAYTLRILVRKRSFRK